MPDVISGVIIALVTYVTIVSRWQSYEKIPNLQRNSGKFLDFSMKSIIKTSLFYFLRENDHLFYLVNHHHPVFSGLL